MDPPASRHGGRRREEAPEQKAQGSVGSLTTPRRNVQPDSPSFPVATVTTATNNDKSLIPQQQQQDQHNSHTLVARRNEGKKKNNTRNNTSNNTSTSASSSSSTSTTPARLSRLEEQLSDLQWMVQRQQQDNTELKQKTRLLEKSRKIMLNRTRTLLDSNAKIQQDVASVMDENRQLRRTMLRVRQEQSNHSHDDDDDEQQTVPDVRLRSSSVLPRRPLSKQVRRYGRPYSPTDGEWRKREQNGTIDQDDNDEELHNDEGDEEEETKEENEQGRVDFQDEEARVGFQDEEVVPFGSSLGFKAPIHEDRPLGDDGLFISGQATATTKASSTKRPSSISRRRSKRDDNDEQMQSLSQDTFSFLISARVTSFPFATGILVFLLKNTIFTLVLLNLIDFTKPFNKIGVPVAVEAPVVVSQLLAFIVSVFTQNDLVNALIQLYSGYDRSIREVYGRNGRGGGGFGQWLMSLSCAFGDGLFGLAVTFLLIVTSGTVLDVLLNFAAVEFVSSLDEAAFYLAQMGFAGRSNLIEAELVANATYTIRPRDNKIDDAKPDKTRGSSKPRKLSVRELLRRHQAIALMFVLSVVMFLWVVLQLYQRQGKYSAKTIIVQFDDQIRPELGPHSGFYSLRTYGGSNPASWFRYVEERQGNAFFGYCLKQREWRFVVSTNRSNNDEFLEEDPCNDSVVFAKSTKTSSLDVLTVSKETWFVRRTKSDHFIPMPDFLMEVGCERDTDCGGTSAGVCIDFQCQCQPNRFGLRCEYDQTTTCSSIQLDERFEPSFPSVRRLATSYTAIPNHATTYERPVFYNAESNDVILYTGVRWAITSLSSVGASTVQQLQDIVTDPSFFAGSITSIDMLSLPVLYQTFDDRLNTPIDIEWEIVPNPTSFGGLDLVASGNPVIMLCAVCNDNSNPCGFDNQCSSETGKCLCTDGSSGTLCQITPEGDGHCDPAFNQNEFGYDGGDCCSATCEGERCGLTTVGDITNVKIGFPYCNDPAVIGDCADPSVPCYVPNAKAIEPISSGGTMIPLLTRNGETLVVGEPDVGIVRVFDLVGSDWIQRGGTLRGTEGSDFGRIVSVVTPPNQVNGPPGFVEAKLAIGEPSTGTVRTFEWVRGADNWNEGPSTSILGSTEFVVVSAIRPSMRLYIGFLFAPLADSLSDTRRSYIMADNGAVDVDPYDSVGPMDDVSVYTVPPGATSLSDPTRYNAEYGAMSSDGVLYAVLHTNASVGPYVTFQLDPIEFTYGDIISSTNRREWRAPVTDLPADTVISHLGVLTSTFSRYLEDGYDEIGIVLVTETSRPSSSIISMTYFRLTDPILEGQDINIYPPLESFSGTLLSQASFQFETAAAMVRAVSSQDGTALAVELADQTVRSFVLDEGKSLFMKVNTTKVTFQNVGETGSPISLSDGGVALAATQPDAVQTYASRVPVCAPDQVTFRLALSLDSSPGRVYWRLFRQGTSGGVTISDCSGCYGASAFQSVSVSKDICVSRVSVQCLGLIVRANFTVTTHGFAAYLIDGDSVTLFASDEGPAVNGTTVYSIQGAANVFCQASGPETPSETLVAPMFQPFAPTTITPDGTAEPSFYPSASPQSQSPPSTFSPANPAILPSAPLAPQGSIPSNTLTDADEPSEFPSIRPFTEAPSIVPTGSEAPSGMPSAMPSIRARTQSPSTAPNGSGAPSRMPSVPPVSEFPSIGPTGGLLSDSLEPSFQPSIRPTGPQSGSSTPTDLPSVDTPEPTGTGTALPTVL